MIRPVVREGLEILYSKLKRRLCTIVEIESASLQTIPLSKAVEKKAVGTRATTTMGKREGYSFVRYREMSLKHLFLQDLLVQVDIQVAVQFVGGFLGVWPIQSALETMGGFVKYESLAKTMPQSPIKLTLLLPDSIRHVKQTTTDSFCGDDNFSTKCGKQPKNTAQRPVCCSPYMFKNHSPKIVDCVGQRTLCQHVRFLLEWRIDKIGVDVVAALVFADARQHHSRRVGRCQLQASCVSHRRATAAAHSAKTIFGFVVWLECRREVAEIQFITQRQVLILHVEHAQGGAVVAFLPCSLAQRFVVILQRQMPNQRPIDGAMQTLGIDT